MSLLPFTSQSNTSLILTPNASAIRNASSSEGEYLPASMAMMVCREAPAFSASSCWVISLAKNRNFRMLFVIQIS